MRRLLALLAVVAAVHGFSTHLDADHVHDQDYPHSDHDDVPVAAARETAISSIALDVSADANDLRMNALQSSLDDLEHQVDGLSSDKIDMNGQLNYMRILKGKSEIQ